MGSLGVGKILDRAPGHLMLALILTIMAFTLAIVPMISSLWLLTVIIIVLGMAEGGLDVSANLLIVWAHQERANPYMNAMHFFFGVGALLAPVLLARAILVHANVNWAFWILAIYPLPWAIWLLRLPAPSSPVNSLFVENHQYRWPLVALISLVFVFYIGAEIGFGGWIYTYAVSLDLLNPAGAALLTSFFWGALTFGRLLGIAIASRFNSVVILIGDFIGCMICLSIIYWAPEVTTFVWVGTLGLGLCMASIFPTLLLFADRNMTLSGSVTRWFFVATGLGGMILPYYLGVLMEKFGPVSIISALWVDISLAFIIFIASVVYSRKLGQRVAVI